MKLNEKQVKFLRRKGHHLKPVVWVGNAGLSDAVVRELDQALSHHELVKIRIGSGDRQSRVTMVGEICERLNAAPVQQIGHVALVYRPDPDLPRLVLPD